ncbi:MAG: hypothetical protein U0228_21155 [Myxococcaceae bacterium]
MGLVSLIAVIALGAAEKPKLAVLDVQAVGSAPAEAAALTDAITQELHKRDFFDLITANDIRTLLGVERQKQLLGCSESNCTAELSGAIGARFVLQSSLTKLGSSLQLSVQMLDTAKAQAVARAVRLAKDPKALAAQLPWMLAEATATPLPPAPSKAFPWTLIAVGATVFAAGGIVAVDGFSRERALNSELGQKTGVFQSYGKYEDELDLITRNKWLGISLLGGGAALAAVGVFIFPRDTNGSFAFLFTGSGFAVAGGF